MIYFDNASSTLPSKECLKEYVLRCEENYANPSSIHQLAMENMSSIERIKERMLAKLKLDKNYEIIFTSGATESNNLAILGYCRKNRSRGNKVITSSYEHESVLNVFKELENEGFKVVYLPIDNNGKVDLETLKKEIDKNTILVSIMSTNNEIGSENDVREISTIIKAFPKCVFHSDLAQGFGKSEIYFSSLDMFTISAHKIYGLKGIGALIKKKSITLEPLFYGGGQQGGVRSGTLDYPSIASFYVAFKGILDGFSENKRKVGEINSRIRDRLSKIEGIEINSPLNACPYILSFSLLKKKASVVVEALSQRGIYVNTVSACNSKKDGPSYVLLSLGKNEEEAKNAIRVSLSSRNTIEEADIFLAALKEILERVRS